MTTAKAETKPATEAADWKLIFDHIRERGLPRELEAALERIRDPEARAKAEEEHKAEQDAAVAKAKAAKDKADEDAAADKSGAKPAAKPKW